MDTEVHQLTAAYALDALDELEEREYEEHLRSCPRCRAELSELTEAAAALAYGVEAPAPPAGLRSRILEQARRERSDVVPLRRLRLALATSAAAAAAAAALAIGFAVHNNSLSDSLEDARALNAVFADPSARSVTVTGADGRVVVTPSGRAALVVTLERAPAGKTYEIWVVRGNRPAPAGLFDAEGGRDAVALTERVPRGAQVLVTLERDGGVDVPTAPPLLRARA